MVIGTRDWEAMERFLCSMELDRDAELRETRKQHIRIALRGGERWYLNLLVSETVRRSKITSMAAAKLGRGSVHDKHMHLRDMNRKEVSWSTLRRSNSRVRTPSQSAQTAHGADARRRAAHPGNDAHRMDGEGRPSQRMGQPRKEEGSAYPRS